MIATATHATEPRPPDWHAEFLAMLPAIVRHAKIAFRHLSPGARQEAIQEVIANCVVAFRRLHELGRADLAYPTVLARYAVAQVRDGRQVGSRLNIKDVLSPYAQRRKGIRVGQLYRFQPAENGWREIVVEDRHAGPDHVAMVRLDFATWLQWLPKRKRLIAELLAIGESTGTVARQFGITAGRVSQLRRELEAAWENFQGEPATA